MATGVVPPPFDPLRRTTPVAREQTPQVAAPVTARTESVWRTYQSTLISLILHVAILILLAIAWTGSQHGTGGDADLPMGIAMVYGTGEEESYTIESGSGNSQGTESGGGNDGAVGEALPGGGSPSNPDAVLAGLLPSGNGAGEGAGNAVGGLGLGDGGGKLGGGYSAPKVKTTVFGIEGTGSKFVYVFDRSDSMNGYEGLPFATAKRELIKSLESLGKLHQFQIIFYNDSPLPYSGLGGSGGRLILGLDDNKLHAASYVKSMRAVGGTEHLPALRMALAMNPDIIFFLTDADRPALKEAELGDIENRAARSGTTIHAIQFGTRSAGGEAAWIARLAEMTGGKFKYVNVTQFRAEDAR
ncbi:MAG: hypothetical protein U0892_11585 [Pirellulales bacterium]